MIRSTKSISRQIIDLLNAAPASYFTAAKIIKALPKCNPNTVKPTVYKLAKRGQIKSSGPNGGFYSSIRPLQLLEAPANSVSQPPDSQSPEQYLEMAIRIAEDQINAIQKQLTSVRELERELERLQNQRLALVEARERIEKQSQSQSQSQIDTNAHAGETLESAAH